MRYWIEIVRRYDLDREFSRALFVLTVHSQFLEANQSGLFDKPLFWNKPSTWVTGLVRRRQPAPAEP